MMKRYVQRGAAASLLVLSGSAAGQSTFSGDDSGFPFSYTGIAAFGAASGGAGINDGVFGGLNDAFDGALAVTVNGTLLSGGSFFVGGAGRLRDLVVPLDAETSATYTLAFNDDDARVRLDVVLANRGTAPRLFTVNVANNLGSDGATVIEDTSTNDQFFTASDRWIITDDGLQGSGDPAVTFAFRGPTNASVAPTSVSDTPLGTTSVTYDVEIDPFDDRILSFFIDMEESVSFAILDLVALDTKSMVRNAYSPNFSGREGRELNFDLSLEWNGSSSNSLLDNQNWEFTNTPQFAAVRIENERAAFLPSDETLRLDAFDVQRSTIAVQPASQLIVFGRFKVDETSELRLDGGILSPGWPILSDGLIRVESQGARITGDGTPFPALRNSGSFEVVGTPFASEFASITVEDDVLNLDQVTLRGGAELRVFELENRANIDVSFANAVIDGSINNTASGLTAVSGGSQFIQMGDLNNDGAFILSTDSSYSLHGSLAGNGIEGPGGPGTAGTVFIRDGVSGRPSGTGLIAFDGPLSVGSVATTVIRLGGTSAGLDFDQIVVAGTFNAAGTIRFESVNGFVPQAGDVFDVLDFDAAQGAFAAIEFDATLDGLGFDTSSLLIDGTIRIPDDCPADTNSDGVVSPADFNAWILAFNSQAPACDQNGDGLCTPADFNAWILNFNAGCP